MPELIITPSRITAAGNKPKIIDELIGHVNTGETRLSIAHMKSPAGWEEPGQRPEFDEYTYVLHGSMNVHHEGGLLTANAGEVVWARAGEWIRYETPHGADYISVCLPGFTPQSVHRDA